MSLYRAQAVVLRTIRLGEADRIVTLATAERGKVRAVAKGVRKTISRWGSRLEPLSHVSVICWKGRELDTVTQAQVLDHFGALRSSLEALGRASVMLEAVDQVMQEGQPNPELYSMLVKALRALESSGSPLVMAGFIWKLLAADGSAPLLGACARCGDPGPLVAFDLAAGGALCRPCRQGLALSPAALGLVRRILVGDLGGVLRDHQEASPLTAELDRLAAFALESHLERRLRSLHVLLASS